MNVPKVKEFLEAMKALGSIRIIINNGVAVRRATPRQLRQPAGGAEARRGRCLSR